MKFANKNKYNEVRNTFYKVGNNSDGKFNIRVHITNFI